jgi:hypothetical protein
MLEPNSASTKANADTDTDTGDRVIDDMIDNHAVNHPLVIAHTSLGQLKHLSHS